MSLRPILLFRLQRYFVYLMCVAVLTACGGQGAVVFAPQAASNGQQLATFDHPTGVFSLEVPPDWVSFVQQSDEIASVTFYLPDTVTPLLSIAVVRLDATDQSTEISALIDAYQTGIRIDSDRYAEQDRAQMSDGSWRMTGVIAEVSGITRTTNTFIEQSDDIFSVVEVSPVESPEIQLSLELALNTLRYNAIDALSPASILELSTINQQPFSVLNVATWSTEAGVFFVTGEVANHLSVDVPPVPVRVRLIDAGGDVVAEASDVAMGHGVIANGFSPFSLRFGDGRPTGMAGFRVQLGDAAWTAMPDMLNFIQATDLNGTSETTISPNGQLTIEGTVSNMGSRVLRDVLAIITVFDDGQRVVAGRFFPVADAPLNPGETTDYAVLIPELGGAPADFIIEYQAIVDE